jgi:hypothetical protein
MTETMTCPKCGHQHPAKDENDILKVKMRMSQWLTGRGMRTDYYILEALDHRSALQQIDIYHQ